MHTRHGVPQIPYVPRIAITQSYVYECAADAKDDRQPPSTWCPDCNRCVPAVKDVAEKRKAFLLEVSVGPKKGVPPRTIVANHVMQLYANPWNACSVTPSYSCRFMQSTKTQSSTSGAMLDISPLGCSVADRQDHNSRAETGLAHMCQSHALAMKHLHGCPTLGPVGLKPVS